MSAETLSNRIVRLLSASAHSLLDDLEGRNPAAIMSQFIRELDDAIGEVAAALGRDEPAKHLATVSIARQNNEIEALSERIDIAVKQNQDEVASAGIAKQLDLEDTIAALHRSLDEAAERAMENEKTLLGLRAKRREMESALQSFLASQDRQGSAASTTSAASSRGTSTRERAEKAEAGFNRTLARASGVTGVVSSTTADPAKLQALETMQRNHRIAERLARVKAASGEATKG